MKNRIYKFRAYSNKFKDLQSAYFDEDGWFVLGDGKVSVNEEDVMQFTGLKDRGGKDIYELMEVNGKYRVEYSVESASYVLTNISNGDIIPLYEFKDKIEITREYSPIQKNPKGGSH